MSKNKTERLKAFIRATVTQILADMKDAFTPSQPTEPPDTGRLTFWTAFSAIFTGILSVFALLSFVALCSQLKDSHDQLSIAAKQLMDARRNFIADQRPYIWYAERDVRTKGIQIGKQVVVTIPYTDFGKSPATQTFSAVSVAIGKDAFTKLRRGQLHEFRTVTRRGKINYFSGVSDDVITNEEMRKEVNANGGIAVSARIRYSDAFDRIYESDFCMIYQVEKDDPWAFCPGDTNKITDRLQDSCD